MTTLSILFERTTPSGRYAVMQGDCIVPGGGNRDDAVECQEYGSPKIITLKEAVLSRQNISDILIFALLIGILGGVWFNDKYKPT